MSLFKTDLDDNEIYEITTADQIYLIEIITGLTITKDNSYFSFLKLIDPVVSI